MAVLYSDGRLYGVRPNPMTLPVTFPCMDPPLSICIWSGVSLSVGLSVGSLSKLIYISSHTQRRNRDSSFLTPKILMGSPRWGAKYTRGMKSLQLSTRMSCDWEGNRRSDISLAMRHRLKWFIHYFKIRDQGLTKGDEHPTNTLHGVWYSLPLP